MNPEINTTPLPRTWFASLREKLVNRPDSEHAQATIRVVLGLFASAYMITAAQMDGIVSADEWHVMVLIGIFIPFSIGILTSVFIYPQISILRRILGMMADLTATTYVLYLMGDTGSPIYGVYLWVSFGNGFRYGPRYLYLSTALSVTGFVFVLITSEYWNVHRTLGVGLLIALIVLPMYVASLVRKLRDQNNELKKLYEQMEKHATHDSLTGLPNRKYFYDYLAETIKSAERDKKNFAVLYLDLDGFKTINDAMGHGVGDQIIENTARRIEQCIRKGDMVARVGGDEFIVLLRNITSFAVSKVAEKITLLLSQPFTIATNSLCITTSIGVATYPQDGAEVNILVHNADSAMYEAKRGGKNGYRICRHKHVPLVAVSMNGKTS